MKEEKRNSGPNLLTILHASGAEAPKQREATVDDIADFFDETMAMDAAVKSSRRELPTGESRTKKEDREGSCEVCEVCAKKLALQAL